MATETTRMPGLEQAGFNNPGDFVCLLRDSESWLRAYGGQAWTCAETRVAWGGEKEPAPPLRFCSCSDAGRPPQGDFPQREWVFPFQAPTPASALTQQRRAEARRAVLRVQAVRPVLAGKTKGTCGTLRSEQAAAQSKATERTGWRQAQSVCRSGGLSKVGCPAVLLCPAPRGVWTLGSQHSQPGKPPGKPEQGGPRGKRLHPVSMGEQGSAWTTP